jgi:hypothetical protein
MGKRKRNRRRLSDREKRYIEYLNSTHWQTLRREKFLQIGGKFCQCCNATAVCINVHHINYKNLVDCTVEDLAALCVECHFFLHRGAQLKIPGGQTDGIPLAEAIELIHWAKEQPRAQRSWDKAQQNTKRAKTINQAKVKRINAQQRQLKPRGKRYCRILQATYSAHLKRRLTIDGVKSAIKELMAVISDLETDLVTLRKIEAGEEIPPPLQELEPQWESWKPAVLMQPGEKGEIPF